MPTFYFAMSLLALTNLAGSSGATVPPALIADAQLRAINHRVVDGFIIANDRFMDTLTGDDFLLTDSDGNWLGRTDFLAKLPNPSLLLGASYDDVRVRLFGPVAVLHGVFETVSAGSEVSRVRYTDVYVWTDGHWWLVNSQKTPVKHVVEASQPTPAVSAYEPWQGQDPIGDDLFVLRTLNENYVEAFRRADVAWYDAHLAPDYVVVFGDGSFHDRTEALADFAQPYYSKYIQSFPVGKVEIRRFEDLALIHAENAYILKDGRKGVNRYTDIWLKQNGTWRCIAAHITIHEAPA